MLAADVCWHAAVRVRGLRPDYLAGHSFGELAAVVAGGDWTLGQAIRVTRSRADAVLGLALGPTRMLAVRATAAGSSSFASLLRTSTPAASKCS